MIRSVIALVLLCHSAIAQQEKFDSLKKLVLVTRSPEKQAILFIDIARSIYINIPDSSIGYCEKAETISKKHHLDVQLAYSLHCECRYLLLKGDIKATIQKLNTAISIFEKKNELKGLAKCYTLKSIALNRLGKPIEELNYLIKAKKIYTDLNDNEGLAHLLPNLANTYNNAGNIKEALYTLGEYQKLNLPKSSLDFYIEINYGNIYFDLNKLAEAITHLKLAIKIAHQYKMLDSEITGITNLAECYLKLNDLTQAKENYQAAITLATKNNLLVEEKEALKGIVSLYEAEKNYNTAFFTLKRLKLIEDSLFNAEKIKSINDIEHKLELTEKEKIIAEQSLSLEKEKVSLAASKNNTLLLIAVLVIIGIAFIFLIYYNGKTKKLFSLIQKQKHEVETQKEIIEQKNKDVMDSIHYAKYIQGSMLPSQKTLNKLFVDNFIFYKPKDVVAGDFYFTDFIDNKPAIAICDCTGHGVPGAMVSIVANNALNRAIKEFKISNPALIFDKVNELMQETFSKSDYQIKDGMDAVLCVFDYEKSKLHIAAANNPVWILSQTQDETWEATQINADKRPIGKHHEESKLFQLKTVPLVKGQMVYLFTDGYADQFGGPKSKKFKYKQLQDLLLTIANKPCQEQKQIIEATFINWKGNLEQVDDILIAGIKV